MFKKPETSACTQPSRPSDTHCTLHQILADLDTMTSPMLRKMASVAQRGAQLAVATVTRQAPIYQRFITTQPCSTPIVMYMQAPGGKGEISWDFERQVLNPERYETCKSGTDDEVAGHKSSYDPSNTTPESEYLADEAECAIDGESHHPLFVSPARREVSEMLNPMVGGAVHGADRLGPSARGWTNKHREVHIKGTPGGPFYQYEKLLNELKKSRQGMSLLAREEC